MECLTNIYLLANPANGDIRYIGKANDINKRLKRHLSEKSNTKKCNWIKSLKSKNINPVIEIIDTINYSEWQFWEKHYISLYKSWGFNLMNGSNGGEGNNYWLGKKRSKEDIKKFSDSHKGIKLSKEQCLEISKRMRENDPMKGKKLTIEHKEKIKKSWETRPTSYNKEQEKINRSNGNKIAWTKRKEQKCFV